MRQPGERALRLSRGDPLAGLILGEHPGDPNRGPARALLELVTQHRGLVLDRHRSDGDKVGLLVTHNQDEVHVRSLSVGPWPNLAARALRALASIRVARALRVHKDRGV